MLTVIRICTVYGVSLHGMALHLHPRIGGTGRKGSTICKPEAHEPESDPVAVKRKWERTARFTAELGKIEKLEKS